MKGRCTPQNRRSAQPGKGSESPKAVIKIFCFGTTGLSARDPIRDVQIMFLASDVNPRTTRSCIDLPEGEMTLILLGTRDEPMPQERVRLVNSSLPYMSYINAAARNFEVDRPERFATLFRDFPNRGDA